MLEDHLDLQYQKLYLRRNDFFLKKRDSISRKSHTIKKRKNLKCSTVISDAKKLVH